MNVELGMSFEKLELSEKNLDAVSESYSPNHFQLLPA